MRRTILLLSLLSSLAACGGPSGGSATQYDPAKVKTAAGFCAALVDASCRNAVACGRFATKEACLSSAQSVVTQASCTTSTAPLQASLDSGVITVDGGALARCLEALASSCDGDGSCIQDAAVGSKKAGDVCGHDAECRPVGYCDGASSGCAGTCKTYRKAGETCSDAERCGRSLYCAAAGTCVKEPAAGEACGNGDRCADGSDCDKGTCRTRADLIASCPHAAGESCAITGSWCASTPDKPMTCGVTFALFVGAGAACDLPQDEEAVRQCQGELVCDATSKTCVAPLAVGASCEGKEWQCGASLVCDKASKTCGGLPEEGKACDHLCAPPFSCQSGVCAAPAATDATCPAK